MLVKELLADTSFLKDLAVQLQPTVNASKRWDGDISKALVRRRGCFDATITYDVPLDLGDFELRVRIKDVAVNDIMEAEVFNFTLAYCVCGHGWDIIFPTNGINRSLLVSNIKNFKRDTAKLVASFIKRFTAIHDEYLIAERLNRYMPSHRLSHQICGLKTMVYSIQSNPTYNSIAEVETLAALIREVEKVRSVVYTNANAFSLSKNEIY